METRTNEKLFCIVTPQARTYYKAVCVGTEFLDKDQNIVNSTGTIPDGEVTEVDAPSVTIKHFENGKLHGKLEVISLEDQTVTLKEEYDHGQLLRVSTQAPHTNTIRKATPIYFGTTLKITPDARAFYVNGKQVAQETVSANGATLELLGNIPDGEVKEFSESGKIKTEAVYQNNKLHGPLVRYDEKGKILSKETYEAGVLQGPAEYFSYTFNQTFHTLCHYNRSLLEGELVITQENGSLRERANYAKGRLHGPRYTYYADGTLESEENWQDGKLAGTRKLYFPTAELWYTENYLAGRLEGERTEFFANGTIHLTEFYSDGLLNGQRNTYDQTGDLLTSEEYHWGNIVHNTEVGLR